MNYFDMERAEADMQAAIAAGDGARYAAIRQQVDAARGLLRPAPVAEQWPVAIPSGMEAYPRCAWWQRLFAGLIDYLIAYFVIVILTVIFLPLGLLAWLAIIIGKGWLEGHNGQTVGKLALGIYTVNKQTRRPIGDGPGIGREFLHILDALPLGLGYIIGLITGRTFADMIMSTIVVKRPEQVARHAAPAAPYSPPQQYPAPRPEQPPYGTYQYPRQYPPEQYPPQQ
jgi:uncharacterized RDD family membrane protein YckC